MFGKYGTSYKIYRYGFYVVLNGRFLSIWWDGKLKYNYFENYFRKYKVSKFAFEAQLKSYSIRYPSESNDEYFARIEKMYAENTYLQKLHCKQIDLKLSSQ